MPSIAFNARVDQIGHYATLPGASDSWLCVLLRSTGIQADATLRDHADLASLLLASNDEALFANYARKPITTVTRTPSNTTDDVRISVPDLTWTQAGSSTGGTNDTVTKALFCYVPSTGAADNLILPLLACEIAATTDGNDLTLRNPNGLVVVSSVQAA